MRRSLLRTLVFPFLQKYYFILKAAAHGWKINYLGGNQFSFKKRLADSTLDALDSSTQFVQRYCLTHIGNLFSTNSCNEPGAQPRVAELPPECPTTGSNTEQE